MKALLRSVGAVVLVIAGLTVTPAWATAFTDGEFYSFSQNTWGADPGAGPPASLVVDHFDSLYPTGMTVGSTAGFFMLFTEGNSGGALLSYLPSVGPPGSLNATLVDPTSSISGIFGGQIAGLRLNIDFSDAGYIGHPTGVAFGDLILTGFDGSIAGLNGLTVRDFSVIANAQLAGLFEPYTIDDISAVLMQINGAFEGGFHDAFADEHLLLPSPVVGAPEPATWMLLIMGIGALGGVVRRAKKPSRNRVVAHAA